MSENNWFCRKNYWIWETSSTCKLWFQAQALAWFRISSFKPEKSLKKWLKSSQAFKLKLPDPSLCDTLWPKLRNFQDLLNQQSRVFRGVFSVATCTKDEQSNWGYVTWWFLKKKQVLDFKVGNMLATLDFNLKQAFTKNSQFFFSWGNQRIICKRLRELQ